MLVALCLVALLGGSDAAPDEPPTVALAELRSHPSRWLNRTVRFTIQYDGLRPEAPTYYSSLGPATHVAFAGWGDGQVLWRRAEFEAPAERLFARRGTSVAAQFEAARRYMRFEVVGAVREVFRGTPWVEVLECRRLERSLTEGALVHATRAMNLMETEQWALAADQFARARAGRLPLDALAELDRLQAVCADESDADSRGRELR